MATTATTSKRSRGTDDLGIYLDRIGQVDLLDAPEERRLGRLVQAGIAARTRLESERDLLSTRERRELERAVRRGRDAHARFVNANLRLVVSIAKGYRRSANLGFNDLIQEGNLGLIHAVDKFDPEKGFKFSTYATFWIKQSIGRALESQSTIRLPGAVELGMRQVAAVNERSLQEHGREATIEEIAYMLDKTPREVARFLNPTRAALSLDAPVTDDGTELGDFMPDTNVDPADVAVAASMADLLREELLSQLDERARQVLESRYGLEGRTQETLEQVASWLGVTRERVRQIERNALAALRRFHKEREQQWAEAS